MAWIRQREKLKRETKSLLIAKKKDNNGDKGLHTFPKSISLKLNVVARLEFELAYFEAVVQHCSHYVNPYNKKKVNCQLVELAVLADQIANMESEKPEKILNLARE